MDRVAGSLVVAPHPFPFVALVDEATQSRTGTLQDRLETRIDYGPLGIVSKRFVAIRVDLGISWLEDARDELDAETILPFTPAAGLNIQIHRSFVGVCVADRARVQPVTGRIQQRLREDGRKRRARLACDRRNL
jgi:hypothetical protein